MSLNQNLLSRRAEAVPRGIVTSLPIFAARAANSELWDVEENRFIDFAAGIATLNVGHCHPAVMAAVRKQIELFTHTAFQVVGYPGYVELCERLNALAPFSEPAKSILFTSGAEATENAIKIARYYTGRSGVIAFGGAFHGRTLLATAATGKVEPYKRGFGTLSGDVYHAMFPVEHSGVTIESALNHLDFLFKSSVDPQQVAAIIVEPVQGEGGFNPAPAEFMQALRSLCDAHGILLIVDEVQTGFGRTGAMFATTTLGVEPDLLPVAKSMGGGFPISAVVGRARIMEKVHPGGLGSTYGGSPISCAAALAVLDVIDDEGLVARAQEIGNHVRTFLAGLSSRNDLLPIMNIRGLGAMIAFDIASTGLKPEIVRTAPKMLVQAAFDRGLILLTCGPGGESIRLLPPLTIPIDVLDEGLHIMADAMADVAKQYRESEAAIGQSA